MLDILRDAARGLRAGKGTTSLAIAMLTLAIAAGTVTFSVVDTIALRPLPFADPGRLVAIGLLTPSGGAVGHASPQDFFAWKDRVAAFDAIGAYRKSISVPVDVGGTQQRLSIARVTTEFLDLLGGETVAGRLFAPKDGEIGGDAVIVLGHGLWTRAFGADPSVVGRTIKVGDDSRTVVGVLAPGWSYPVAQDPPTDAYIPSVATAEERIEPASRLTFDALIVGRLRGNATIAQAQQQIDALNSARPGARPGQPRSHLVLPLLDWLVGPARMWLRLVLAAVGCLLVVACVNVASLLLARAATRVRELATREILGASRRRLALTLLCEGALLAAVSAAVGVGIAAAALEAVKANLPGDLVRASTISLDPRVLSISIAVVSICGLAFASAPAWLASRTDRFAATRSNGGGVIGSHRGTRALGAMLAAELGVVTTLLVSSTILVTSFVLFTTADLGYDRRNVAVFSVQKSLATTPADLRASSGAAFRGELLRAVSAAPGVAGAALIRVGVPFSGRSESRPIAIPGADRTSGSAAVRVVSPEYFPTMQLRLARGRPLEAADRLGAPRVAVINERLAERFGAREPVGQTLRIGGDVTIVGVVRGVRMFGPDLELDPEIYLPIDQRPTTGDDVFDLVVRTTTPVAAAAPAIRRAAQAVLADGEIFQPRFLDDAFRSMTADRRFNAALMTTFGLVAVVIGAIGVYGTMAFEVARSVRAIGLRLALGATAGRVRRDVIVRAITRVAAGAAIGLAGAWAMSGLFTSLLFGVQPTSVWVYLGVAVMLGTIGVAAALIPAVRASKLDPLVALRSE